MKITLPEFCLVLLIGVSGSGKSTFARAHFRPSEVLSSDACRAWIADDENDQSVTRDAFEVLNIIAAKRLANLRLTVIDATNVQPEGRRPLLALARQYHCIPMAIVFDLPEPVCLERDQARPNRHVGSLVISRQRQQLHQSLSTLKDEGFRRIYVLKSPQEVAEVSIVRQPLACNRRHETGPFDIIGDVHGCLDTLLRLLAKLGYRLEPDADTYQVTPPAGRTAIFLGDLVNHGPQSAQVLRLVMAMVAAQTAKCVPGDHDVQLLRALQGKPGPQRPELSITLAQLEDAGAAFSQQVADFILSLASHYVLDEGRLVVAHAGLPAELQGRISDTVRAFALFGETRNVSDRPDTQPPRWVLRYRGRARVVYGHTPLPRAEWINRTLNLDTGCAFGGALTALRYPEGELVSVPAVDSAPSREGTEKGGDAPL